MVLALGLAMAAARLCRGTLVGSVLGTCILHCPPSWKGGWHSSEGVDGYACSIPEAVDREACPTTSFLSP